MIEKDLYLALKEVCDRVYPLKLPQNALYPAITYMVVNDGQNQTTNGKITSRDVRFQVDIWCETYEEAKSLKDSVVAKITELYASSIYAQDFYEDEVELYRELIDFTIKRT